MTQLIQIGALFFVIVSSNAEWGVLADSGMPLLVIGLLVVALLGPLLMARLARSLEQRCVVVSDPNGRMELIPPCQFADSCFSC